MRELRLYLDLKANWCWRPEARVQGLPPEPAASAPSHHPLD